MLSRIWAMSQQTHTLRGWVNTWVNLWVNLGVHIWMNNAWMVCAIFCRSVYGDYLTVIETKTSHAIDPYLHGTILQRIDLSNHLQLSRVWQTNISYVTFTQQDTKSYHSHLMSPHLSHCAKNTWNVLRLICWLGVNKNILVGCTEHGAQPTPK